MPFAKISIAATLVCLLSLGAAGPDMQERAPVKKRFTNADVIEMVKMGLSDEIIIAKIRSAAAVEPDSVSLDTSLDGLKALKQANVPDSVIKIMINPTPAPAAIITGAAPVVNDPNLPPPEIGVYWKDGTQFTLLQGQAVTNT